MKNTDKTFLPRLRENVTLAGLLLFLSAVFAIREAETSRPVTHDKAEPRAYSFRSDPNTAEWRELVLLPGIGERLAQGIVDSRDQDGPFSSNDSLLRVSGIGKKKLETIKPYLVSK